MNVTPTPAFNKTQAVETEDDQTDEKDGIDTLDEKIRLGVATGKSDILYRNFQGTEVHCQNHHLRHAQHWQKLSTVKERQG